jgi:hypothetical protein
MKTITAIQTWVNGKSVQATIFNLYVIGGTLGSSASFYYSLLDDSLAQVSQGNLTMSGEAYEGWGNDDEYAWTWASTELGLTITGNYVPPAPPAPPASPVEPVETVVEPVEPIAPTNV